jgi:copper chaperone CopZ
MADLQRVELIVEGGTIHCEVCERHVQGVVSKIPGVVHVKADYKAQTISLTLDPEKKPLVQVLTTLEFMGYQTVEGAAYRGME